MDSNEIGSCGICFNLFDNQLYVPLLLGCGHTFCKECLKNSTNKLRRAKLQYNSMPNDKTKSQLDECMMCPMRCPNAFYRDSVDELQVNKVVLDSIKHFNIQGPSTDEALTIRICCCPANISIDKFSQHFLGQLDFKYKSLDMTD